MYKTITTLVMCFFVPGAFGANICNKSYGMAADTLNAPSTADVLLLISTILIVIWMIGSVWYNSSHPEQPKELSDDESGWCGKQRNIDINETSPQVPLDTWQLMKKTNN